MNTLEVELKELVISTLNLEDLSVDDIKTDQPLFGDGLGLDSIDALELGVAIKKKYKVSLEVDDGQVKKHFYSIQTLSEFINNSQQALS
ncbi:acyl carrier protein [compost metagenome]